MRNTRIEPTDTVESKPINNSEPEVDYSPKVTPVRDQIIYGIKMFAVFGTVFLILWLYEKFLA